MKELPAALLRLARVLVAQAITWSLAKWGNINIPALEITVGALANSIMKYIRDKYPDSVILTWLPL